MSEPIRVLHFADLHIGIENYGRIDPASGLNQRVVDFLERLDQVVEYAITHEADLVLFAGDAFRTRGPSPTHQREFAQRIRRLSQAAIPTVLLVGNHDVPVMEQRASSVEIFDTLGVPHVTVVARPTLLHVETRHGLLQLAAIPYPVRQRLLTREQFRQMSQEALDRAVSEVVVHLIQQLATQLDGDTPAVLTGHFSVESAHWGAERNIMVGRDVTIPLSALTDTAWDYVALGHIHQHQNLNPENRPPVVYAGSLERVDFGEEKQPKGFCWVEVQRGTTEWRYVEVPARSFVTVRVDVRRESHPLKAIERALSPCHLADAVVRLIVQMSPEQEAHLRDADLTPFMADAFFVQINRDVDHAVRDRLDGVEPDALTPLHLLERYLQSRGKTEAEMPAYRAEAQAIFVDEGDNPPTEGGEE
ncbi:MAG TPA: exonuclease SbcCD subunit D [Anaerolineae bacterium]|nr:exonuclease SbcCD subunit D [Anaerolineae bacterium]HQH38072.1 exonuclease SbcCD subunit D [Anaerolineae bacterium]